MNTNDTMYQPLAGDSMPLPCAGADDSLEQLDLDLAEPSEGAPPPPSDSDLDSWRDRDDWDDDDPDGDHADCDEFNCACRAAGHADGFDDGWIAAHQALTGSTLEEAEAALEEYLDAHQPYGRCCGPEDDQ